MNSNQGNINVFVMFNLIFWLFAVFVFSRVVYLSRFKSNKALSKKNCKSLIVIGSGGHTLEMVKHVNTLNPNWYKPRLYVMADIDTSSEYKIQELEKNFNSELKTDYSIVKIPRSRIVNQSYFTSVFTTLYSTLSSIPVVLKFKPDLILSNGPGTCIPICIIGYLLNVLLFFKTKIVFVESICRVKTLSLSGKILLYFADVIIVQWESLHKIYPQTVFIGRLI